jgi:hypothetical protein
VKTDYRFLTGIMKEEYIVPLNVDTPIACHYTHSDRATMMRRENLAVLVDVRVDLS